MEMSLSLKTEIFFFRNLTIKKDVMFKQLSNFRMIDKQGYFILF